MSPAPLVPHATGHALASELPERGPDVSGPNVNGPNANGEGTEKPTEDAAHDEPSAVSYVPLLALLAAVLVAIATILASG